MQGYIHARAVVFGRTHAYMGAHMHLWAPSGSSDAHTRVQERAHVFGCVHVLAPVWACVSSSEACGACLQARACVLRAVHTSLGSRMLVFWRVHMSSGVHTRFQVCARVFVHAHMRLWLCACMSSSVHVQDLECALASLRVSASTALGARPFGFGCTQSRCKRDMGTLPYLGPLSP